MRRRAFLSALVAGLLESERALAQSISCGAPPPAKPQRIKGGESFPPLPLPVTPLRRTERKRPPAPPVLIAKLKYGEKKTATAADGSAYDYFDWKSDPGDAAALLKFAGPHLGIQYREQIVGPQLAKVDPRENPILYVTGHQRPEVPSETAALIRDFVLTGGTIWGDACCGSAPFTEGFLEFMRQTFPERRFAPAPPEHPLFRAFFPVEQVTFKEGQKVTQTGPPELYCMELGCRAAVVFTQYDLSCGWDSHEHDVGGRIEAHDAMRLGTNMLAYTLANQELGRFLSTTKTYYEKYSEPGADEFVFGQLIHDGDWDPDPSAVANLLKAVESNSAIGCKFVRRTIKASEPSLFDVPFMYMTGHHGFAFSDEEIQNLRAYLGNGGFLFADACCGRKDFDEAFRAELGKIMQGRLLEPIPQDDPVYSCLYRINQVRFALRADNAPPGLLGIRMEGAYNVVYSPSDLGNGWEGVEHPFVDGVAPDDSLRLGMNVIMYALTH